ncbi:MFS transporter [Pseudomonas versuta]|uniref:MFS transporter n=1 Tax=Pseudomonas versuta TaxID=1788301 RepID=A0A0M4RHE6_9PSED|nr:MFS transporter [Pseudomonas versuta]ALE88733.1 MFS transporter [Pseudomonas versuta]OKA21807.1 MFS transporter [Pseudomonas versuta]OKA29229.1 MFS transporter [Pseudomonas versuta]
MEHTLSETPAMAGHSSTGSRGSRKKNIAAVTIGNGLEFYDFTVYSFFATVIGKQFFPADGSNQLLLAFATYGIGFFMRPLGSILLGQYADRVGRKAAMILTLWLMAIGSLIFVLTPSYAQIGIAAPLMIVFARLLQGFAIGGEVGASTTYLMEKARSHERGYFTSWQFFSQGLSVLLGAMVGLSVNYGLSEEQVAGWGWRIPFVIGLLVIPVGSYMRRHLQESDQVKRDVSHRLSWGQHKQALVAGILIAIGGTSGSYVILHYLSNFAVAQLHLPLSVGIWTGCAAGAVQVALAVASGRACDRWGRKRMILWSRLAMLVLIYPAFILLQHSPTLPVLVVVASTLAALLVCNTVPSLVMLAEIFPAEVRATGLSVTYALASIVFGGFAQFFCTLLISLTGNPSAPAFYLIACGLISLLGLVLVKEPTQR